MTPREVHLFFRGREKAIERQEKAALRRAYIQAFHTERFARLKKISSQDLKMLLDSVDSTATGKKPMSQHALWSVIKATHAAFTAKQRPKSKRQRRG
jgi:hypothetical protein